MSKVCIMSSLVAGDSSVRSQQNGADYLEDLQPSNIPIEPGGKPYSHAPLERAPISGASPLSNLLASDRAQNIARCLGTGLCVVC